MLPDNKSLKKFKPGISIQFTYGIIRILMKILVKSVRDRFQSFYRNTIPRIGIPIIFERGSHGTMGQYRRENGIARIKLDTSLIETHFEETAAHELLHAVQDS